MTAPQATFIMPGGEFPTTIHILDQESGRYSVSSPYPREVIAPLADNLVHLLRLAQEDVESAKAQTQEEGPDHVEEKEEPEAVRPVPDAALTPSTAQTPEADTSAIRAVEVAVPMVVDLNHWDAWCQGRGLDANLDPRTHGHLVSQYQKEVSRV